MQVSFPSIIIIPFFIFIFLKTLFSFVVGGLMQTMNLLFALCCAS